MFKQLLRLYKAFEKKQRNMFISTLGIFIVVSVLEVLLVISIGPFIKTLMTDGKAGVQPSFSENYTAHMQGIMLAFIVMMSSGISIYGTWRISHYAALTGSSVGDVLYREYLSADLEFFDYNTTGDLIRKITTEANRISFGVIQPLMTLISRSLICFSIIVYLAIFETSLIIYMGLLIAVFYIVMYASIKNILAQNGRLISGQQSSRLTLIVEGFGNHVLIKLRNAEYLFVKKFINHGEKLARALALNTALAASPRYLIETLLLISVISLVLLESSASSLIEAIPQITVLALAAMRLLPNFQNIFSSISTIKGNVNAISEIIETLENKTNHKIEIEIQNDKYPNWREITLENFSFSYNGLNEVFKNANITIKRNKKYSLIGPSGSGKSTFIELLMRFRELTEGRYLVDGQTISLDDRRALQRKISYVPQKTTLLDATIRENIAFTHKGEIRDDLVWHALKISQLTEEVENLEYGINEVIGQDGELLSGGQRQRMSLARAIYGDPEILILDEVTSALDNKNSREIIKNLLTDKEKTVIMITHDEGQIIDTDFVIKISDKKIDIIPASIYNG